MFEEEYFRSSDYQKIWMWLTNTIGGQSITCTNRKMRLVAVNRARDLYEDKDGYWPDQYAAVVKYNEQLADDPTLHHMYTPYWVGKQNPKEAAEIGLWAKVPGHCDDSAALIHDLFGPLPYRHIKLESRWLFWQDGVVVRLAREIYNTKAFANIPLVADALVEAGASENHEVVRHLRGWRRCRERTIQGYECEEGRVFYLNTGTAICHGCEGSVWIPTPKRHWRGCWAIDLVLQKS